MTRVYVVRHAEAEGNLYRRIHGWYDSRITENGKRQIAALSHRFQDIHIDAVYASALRRTQLTAQSIVQPKNLELNIDPGLNEIKMGIYEGMPFGELDEHAPEKQAQFISCSPDWKPEGGESFQELQDRITSTVLKLAKRHSGETIAVFSHGAAIKCLLSAAEGKHPSETPGIVHCDNTGVSCLDIEGDHMEIVFKNDNSHLPEEIATLVRQKKAAEKFPPVFAWFRPMDMDQEAQIYYESRKDAWQSIHGSLRSFDGPAFLSEAMAQWEEDPKAVQCVIDHGTIIGLLQMATHYKEDEGIGHVPFVYLKPEYRCRGIGVQLIGEAVSYYRQLGRDRIQLRCAPDNYAAQRFYQRYGFVKIGDAPGARVPLDLMEMNI